MTLKLLIDECLSPYLVNMAVAAVGRALAALPTRRKSTAATVQVFNFERLKLRENQR